LQENRRRHVATVASKTTPIFLIPDVIAQEIVEDFETAGQQFVAITNDFRREIHELPAKARHTIYSAVIERALRSDIFASTAVGSRRFDVGTHRLYRA